MLYSRNGATYFYKWLFEVNELFAFNVVHVGQSGVPLNAPGAAEFIGGTLPSMKTTKFIFRDYPFM